jgi:photosystem II stability/assembly factor-like uncharacterized protein
MSVRRGLVLATLALLIGILAGCSADLGNDLYSGLAPGPTPPARPGAYVWVVGVPDLILGSSNGGASWKVGHRSTYTDIITGDLWAVAFGDVDHGWAVRRGIGSPRATVLATADAGATWAWQYPGPKNGRLLGVAASGATHVWAVGYQIVKGLGVEGRGHVIATADGGSSWQRQHLPAGLSPFRVAFADVRHGWILAGDGDHTRYYVLSTSDGGAHWRVSYSAAKGISLAGIAAVGADRCWAVGYGEHPQSGFVARTTDGGRRWSAQAAVSRELLAAISFPDARYGWAVGPAGTVVTTSDGGATWSAQEAGGDFGLTQVSFSDRRHGWALIGHLALLATVDGGTSWSVVRPADTRDGLTGLTTVQSQSVGGQ